MALKQFDLGVCRPVWCGEWDRTKAYEFLNFVERNDAIYQAVQDVPAGIDITNETYWKKTSGASTIPEFAGIEEVEQMLNEVFGATAGDTVDGASVASDDEVTEMIDSVFTDTQEV